MLPKISYNIYWLLITSVVDHESKSSKISTTWCKCNKYSTEELMSHTSKTFQSIHVHLKKGEEAYTWILYSYFICLSNHPNIWWFILHRISRLLKFKLDWLRGPTNDSAEKNEESRGIIQAQVIPVKRQLVDNSANAHICSEEDMSNNMIEYLIYNGV